MAAKRARRVGSGFAVLLLTVGAAVVSGDSLADIHPNLRRQSDRFR